MKDKSWLKKNIVKYSKSESYILEGKILDITEQISRGLIKKGLTKKDLADKLNSSQAYVTKLLNGSNNYTLKTLVKISESLDLDLDIRLNKKSEQDYQWWEATAVGTDSVSIITCEDVEKRKWSSNNISTIQDILSGTIKSDLVEEDRCIQLN